MKELTYIQKELFKLQDTNYREFHSCLMPTINKDCIIGVRTPELRKLAGHLWKHKNSLVREFMNSLPHKYYEENNLHAVFIQSISEFDECLYYTENFLPYIDNWATCDMMVPKALGKNLPILKEKADTWIASGGEFAVRFGIGVYMRYFLDEHFKESYLEKIASLRSDKYYINMMIAWYFATALAKQYNFSVKILKKQRLDKWVHNKTIQKAVESYRITETEKKYLRTLKIK